MICQKAARINTYNEEIWTIPLSKLYEDFVSTVRARTATFYLPCLERPCKSDDYILWGSYHRKSILDIQMIRDENGNWTYIEVNIPDLRIQRIRVGGDGPTHAILLELFVPFGSFSLRYVLFHLSQFFSQHTSYENYCEGKSFSARILEKWVKWLKQNSTTLGAFGLTEDREENRQNLLEWIKKMKNEMREWLSRSLRVLNLGLFQNHRMPENTMYRKLVLDG